ncbi:hypothetical protein [Psychrobacter glacincola]|uniref:hypothetical protein n=1 Tax=Psychrobacter glacincola TaxID=56810 RepID=UPI0039B0BA91
MTQKFLDVTQQANVMLVQKHLTEKSETKIGEISNELAKLKSSQDEVAVLISEAYSLFGSIEDTDSEEFIILSREFFADYDEEFYFIDNEGYILEDKPKKYHQIELLEVIDYNAEENWDDIYSVYEQYALRNDIDLSNDPFKKLMSESQRIEFEQMVKQDFTYQKAQCDKYDYMLAVTCGALSGIIDICFVSFKLGSGNKGNVDVIDNGPLTKSADKLVDQAVIKFAKLVGWEGSRDGKDTIQSAIGFLEKKYRINYDHRHTADVGSLFSMNTKNHHIMSLGHSPDIVGLFFSILDQFTSQAHFIADGKLVSVDSEFKLKGGNFIAKIFCGFANWLGHLFSDIAGSSGTRGQFPNRRGSGIPIPFYSLLQLLDFGKFNVNDKDKGSFAQACVMAFQKGYDARHGLAMAVPVLICELLTRLMYLVKQKFYHKKSWADSTPSMDKPEVVRMLLVSHGTLSLIDAGHAGFKSGGNLVAFIMQSNVIAYARFATVALKEVKNWYYVGKVDPEKIESYLDDEYARMLSS